MKDKFGKLSNISDYEKKRLDKLKFNVSRMEAKGLGSMAKRILSSHLEPDASKIDEENPDQMDSDERDDVDYQPNIEEDGKDDENNFSPAKEAPKNKINISSKGNKGKLQQTLPMAPKNQTNLSIKVNKIQPQQTLSMAEFAMTRSKMTVARQQLEELVSEPLAQQVAQKTQVQPNGKGSKNKAKEFRAKQVGKSGKIKGMSKQSIPIVEAAMTRSRVILAQNDSSQNPLQASPAQNKNKDQPEKAQRNTERGQEKCLKKQKCAGEQYCAPGSITGYAKLRRRQVERRVELNVTAAVQEEEHRDTFGVPQDLGSSSNVLLPEALMEDIHNDENIEENEVDNQNDQDCIVAEKKKHRGPTMMVKVHQRDYSERKGVTLNESGEPIGPPSVVTELSSFLGTIAKDPTLVPINIPDWRFMPTKDDIWSYVKEKYHIDDLGKKYVLDTVNENWRVHKSRLRKDHFMPYTTDEQGWKKRPKSIPDNQFKDLLEYWNSPVGMELSRINAANRKKYDDVHTLGSRSIAILRYELEKKNPDQPIPDSLVYKESRKRNPKRAYKTDDSKTKEYIAKMDDLQVQIDKGEKDKM